MRQPSQVDIKYQMVINALKIFPIMFTLLDFMHYHWKNYLIVWQGQFTNENNHK